MNDTKYIEKMVKLTQELEAAASAEPYDPDVYNNVVARCNALHFAWYHSRRRRPWLALASCIILLIVLLLIVLQVLSVLYMKGA